MGPLEIKHLAQSLEGDLIAWRRDFHQHPELAYEEQRSSTRIIDLLKSFGLDPLGGIAETGVIVHIEGRRATPRVLLRFDMDALPIQENNQVTYRSQNDGVMHACGHDGHMAIGLGVATLLQSIKDQLPGSAVLIFQPAEEGQHGARRMIDDGVLDLAKAEYALGMHIWNEKPFGWLGVTEGPCMAGADELRFDFTGVGGHGAQPHLAQDPILAAAHVITALQSIISRHISPLESAVLSITSIQAGDAFNVIPSQVSMLGTLRAFSDSVRSEMLSTLERVSKSVAGGLGCSVEIHNNRVAPPLINDEMIAYSLAQLFQTLYPEGELDQNHRVMGSEDMAYFLQAIPGCYFFVGSANPEQGLDAPHHNPNFDFDEAVLPKAVHLCATATLSLMRRDTG
jgi:amidohydrolase